MTISLRLSNEEAELFKSYADVKSISVSELIRLSVLERIEDEFDLKSFEELLSINIADPPILYSLKDVATELGLS